MLPKRSLDSLLIRKLEPTDSLADLTKLLNRAYKRLADMGLNYVATYQDEKITRERISGGTCLVAVLDGQIVGTIMYRSPEQAKGADWYDKPTVAKISQMGVEPPYQKNGIGLKLLNRAEQLARTDGAQELALDTAESADHLIAWYNKLGFRFVEFCDWEITNYRSVILSKKLV